MSNYYNSGYGNPPSGSDGSAGTSSNSYYGGGYSQPTTYATDQQSQQSGQQPASQQTEQQQPAYGQPSYADPNQWKQQSQQQAPAQAPPQATTQQQQPSFWSNPSAVGAVAAMAANSMATGGNNPNAMFDLIQPHAQTFLKSGAARMVPGLETFMTTLRRYFQVDNRYVKTKLQRIFFPFLCKSWQRVKFDAPSQGGGMSDVAYALPHSDENAPDLYIPAMSLITYVLLCALVYGNAGQFNPEVLPAVASLCFMTQIVEVLLIRFGYYMMQAPVAFLDLFSYTGYKYFGLCINMLAAILTNHFGLGKETYYVFFLYTASAASFFMLKTMANNIPLVVAATGPKREIMVVVFALSQCLTMYIMSKTKFLS
eukprot:CAMPEP_0178916362 /NCGR_PEP_ID=MMETSP0786-20121207/12587_1 /TAXON_ID=186022 /ORGANISM="Thalassionema frauenfeldii, Strain CCMP 1798" /LENGTH=368 /DNA_ID=CAMNT_0020589669 /DNA_START=85 /DNA_END=1191 /DNA_ORIENTATION=-